MEKIYYKLLNIYSAAQKVMLKLNITMKWKIYTGMLWNSYWTAGLQLFSVVHVSNSETIRCKVSNKLYKNQNCDVANVYA